MWLNSWFQHSFYRDSTTATHCCLVCQGQLFSLCSMWWMQRLESLRDHVKPALKQLRWLPVEAKNNLQAMCLCTTSTSDKHQKYLSDCVSTVSAASGRYRLRSTSSAAYVLPRTRTKFGERGFFYSGLAAWNTLPSDLHDITDTSIHSGNDSRMYFLIVLTTDYCWRSWTSRIAASYKSRVDWLIDWYIVINYLLLLF